MRHKKKLEKLGLAHDHRKALLKNLVSSLVIHERIRTTASRARATAARFARAMRVVRKKEPREAIRMMPQFVSVKEASFKLVGELKKKYENRTSGFTRITRVGIRKGDSAALVQIELI